jgi:hypothetical protein
MGEGSEWIAASSGGSENNWVGTCEAHHVGISPQEDRGGAKVTLGEVEEGGVASGGKTRDRDGWAVSSHAVLMLTCK